MSDNTAFDAWLDRLCQRPLPTHPMARVRTLAKELAEGAIIDVWDTHVFRWFRGDYIPTSENISAYLTRRWGDQQPHMHFLTINGYFNIIEGNPGQVYMAQSAFDLLDEAEAANIFISYKRSESSAFALLVLARLKASGLEPFLDLALVPGEDWHAGLKDRIQDYDYLIAILGRDTLTSEVVVKEISWALAADVNIIPIWHNGFKYHSADWPGLPPEVDRVLSSTHTIRVLEESALAYNNAVVELLNRFGITP